MRGPEAEAEEAMRALRLNQTLAPQTSHVRTEDPPGRTCLAKVVKVVTSATTGRMS